MQRKSLYSAMTLVLATAGLVACGGGGGGGDDTSTTTTSSKTTVGEITAFGSVYVNGIEFDTDSSTYDVDDDNTADQSDLAVGMYVRVEGSVNDDGLSGTATSIYYDDDVEGPIDAGSLHSIDATTKTFSVLGLPVLADANTTVFDDTTFDALSNGDVVEVSGTFDGIQIVATRIEGETGDLDYELKGTVVSYDGSTIELTLINGMPAGPYAVADNASSEIAVGTTGVFVEIELTDDGSGNLTVTEIETDDADSLDGDEDDVSIEGLISGDATDGFFINSTPFTVNDNTVYEPTDLVLVEGMLAEVEGYMQDGTLVATQVEAEHEGEDEIEIEAEVISTDTTAGSITLKMNLDQSLTVLTDNSTLYEDSDDLDTNGDGSFTLSELTAGQFVEVEAYATDTGLLAAKLEREDSLDATTLKAPVDEFVSGSSVTLLGITYMMDGNTSYEVDEVSKTSTEFFDALDVGDVVEIQDVEPDGTAEEADLDQSS
jgi:hypothetical protein